MSLPLWAAAEMGATRAIAVNVLPVLLRAFCAPAREHCGPGSARRVRRRARSKWSRSLPRARSGTLSQLGRDGTGTPFSAWIERGAEDARRVMAAASLPVAISCRAFYNKPLMPNYRIYRMKEAPRQHFRSAPHVSGAANVKRKDYEEARPDRGCQRVRRVGRICAPRRNRSKSAICSRPIAASCASASTSASKQPSGWHLPPTRRSPRAPLSPPRRIPDRVYCGRPAYRRVACVKSDWATSSTTSA